MAPAVITQPADQTVVAGETASFTAEALGYPAPTVQWQVSTDAGKTWSDVAGATATTYSFVAQVADTGNQYRAIFSNSMGGEKSNAATLTVTRR